MGVRGLFHYCKSFLKPPEVKSYRVGIDAYSLLYRFYGDFDKIYEFLAPLLNNKLIFVFDGKAPKYKEKEIEIRKAVKTIAEKRIQQLKNSLEKLTNEETSMILKKRIQELERDNWYLTYEIRQSFKKFLYSKNLTYVNSIEEADSLLIDLYYNNIIDAVLSSDMDYLVAGVNILFVPVKNILKQLTLSEILEFEEINLEQFKEIAILMGVDNSRIFACDDLSIAATFIRHYGSIQILREKQENLFNDAEIDISEIKKRFYPNKSPLIHLKVEHKDTLERFHGR